MAGAQAASAKAIRVGVRSIVLKRAAACYRPTMHRRQALDYAAKLERLALRLSDLEMSEVDYAVTCNCAVCRMWRDGVCATRLHEVADFRN
jgi:hypothetical protein